MPSSVLVAIVISPLLIIVLRNLVWSQQAKTLPPGPKGLPLVGNILDMPKSHQWKTFSDWGNKWGSIMSITIFGQPIVILNSQKHAMALLERRGAIYSDRPPLYVGGELVGWNRTLPLARYGPHFRDMRRLVAQCAGNRSAVSKHLPLLETEARQFVARLLKQPDAMKQIRRYAGSSILKLTYGYELQDDDDVLLNVVHMAAVNFSVASSPGAFFVDYFPILKHVPAWFPGTTWQRTIKSYAGNFNEMCDFPHEYVKANLASGNTLDNFTATSLEDMTSPEHEYTIKMAAASIYVGGADTIVSAVGSFFLAMTCYPEVQKRAQHEIDTVVGNERLPTLEDRDRLPYLEALLLEVLRWNPVIPLITPHRLLQDDVYEGYTFPKGSIVIANAWHILHDPDRYSDPMEFRPERFLEKYNEPEPDPRAIAFGFGRRKCPGIHLADTSMFLSCASALSVLDISKASENGVTIEPVVEYTTGTISHPPPFKCSIKPRSRQAEALLRSTKDA